MNPISNRRIVRYTLFISLVISSIVAVLVSLQDVLPPQYSFKVVYLIYLPSFTLLIIAFHNQLRRRDILGVSAIVILTVLIVFNILIGGVA